MKTTALLLASALLVLASGCNAASKTPAPDPKSPFIFQTFPESKLITTGAGGSISHITFAPKANNLPPVALAQSVGENFTLALWFTTTDAAKLNATGASTNDYPMTLATLSSKDSQQQLVIRLARGKVVIVGTNDKGKTWPDLSAPTAIKAAQWYYLVLVRTPDAWRLYINGNLASTNIKIPALPDLSSLTYGRAGNKRFLVGTIATPYLLKTPLSHPDIQKLYANPPAITTQ